MDPTPYEFMMAQEPKWASSPPPDPLDDIPHPDNPGEPLRQPATDNTPAGPSPLADSGESRRPWEVTQTGASTVQMQQGVYELYEGLSDPIVRTGATIATTDLAVTASGSVWARFNVAWGALYVDGSGNSNRVNTIASAPDISFLATASAPTSGGDTSVDPTEIANLWVEVARIVKTGDVMAITQFLDSYLTTGETGFFDYQANLP